MEEDDDVKKMMEKQLNRDGNLIRNRFIRVGSEVELV